MSEPRVLLYDIETSPNIGYTWGQWEQNVIQFKQEWHLLSFAWKWQDEKRVYCIGLDDFPKTFKKDPADDSDVAWELHQLIDQADITVAHNGDRFDMRKARARFLVHGFDPPSPVRQVDTLKVARSVAMFNSNKLGDLGHQLGVGGKASTGGFKTWLGCMAGDPKCWALMKKYNKEDVALLERVYLRLLPWIENHPNRAVISCRPDACPKCGVEGQMQARGPRKINATTSLQRFQCQACGGWSSARLSEKDTPKPRYK